MRVSDIMEAIRAGTMTCDTAGHVTNFEPSRLLEAYDRQIALASGSNDGKWRSAAEKDMTAEEEADLNKRMREHYQHMLNEDLKQEDTLMFLRLGEPLYCFGCGERLQWVVTDDKLMLRHHTIADPTARFGIKFVNYPADYRCAFENPQPMCGEIKVTSNLIIANFFRSIEDAPAGKEHSDEFDLNSLAGRANILAYKAEYNVAYGQLFGGNLSVYTNEARDSVIIGHYGHPADYISYPSPAEYRKAKEQAIFPGYKEIGSVDLTVRRWEATDVATIDAEYEELINNNEREHVELSVPHGVWKFQHNYDAIRHVDQSKLSWEERYMYARLDLKK